MDHVGQIPWNWRSHERGVTLIEVLVAIVVLALGLIGIAGLQTAALNNNQLSSQYTNAATLAQNLAERMRANKAGALANAYNMSPGIPPEPEKNCAADACSSQQLAAWDLAQLYASAVSTDVYTGVAAGPHVALPSPLLGVNCGSTCDQDATRMITVYWDADRTGATGTGCTSNSADLRCFSIPFIP